jgi:short-subunit dehydrogenase
VPEATDSEPRPEVVLVTGASSGIGEALAHRFAASGSTLVLVARREDRLRALAAELAERHGTRTHVRPADLTDASARADLVEGLAADGIDVDVLVNNAGFGQRADFADLSWERQHAMIELNVTALAHLMRAFLPSMLDRGRGGVLNVASTAAFQAGPHMSVYYATKAFVLALSEGVAEEVRGRGVAVSCLCPGPTLTEFAGEADMEGVAAFKYGAMLVEPVARAGYEGFRKGEAVVVPGLANKLGAVGAQLMPRVVSRKLVGKIQA